MNQRGQIAIEYLLIFFVSIIILSVITLPTITQEVDNSNDIRTTLEVEQMLLDVSNSVRLVQSSDYDSQRTISVNCPCYIRIYYGMIGKRHYIYAYVNLSDNTQKEVMVEVPCKVTFTNQPSYYYTTLYERWYYNTEVKWITSSTGEKSVNVYFKY